jgi:hypothetical protein
MLTGWTGRKWDAGPLGAKHRPERIIAHGPINFMCAPAATAASRHGFSYAVNSSFPHPKINLVVSADLRAGIIESTAKGLRTKQDAPSEILICNSKLDYLIDRDVQ